MIRLITGQWICKWPRYAVFTFHTMIRLITNTMMAFKAAINGFTFHTMIRLITLIFTVPKIPSIYLHFIQ